MKCRIKQIDLVCIELTLKNDSNEAIEIDIRHSPLDYNKHGALRNKFFNIKRGRSEVQYRGIMAKSAAPPKYVTIEPGEKITSVLNLSTGYDLESDTYTIDMLFFIGDKQGELHKLKSNKIDFIIPEIE